MFTNSLLITETTFECVFLQELILANKYLVVVAGPTAVGKTALSIELAKHYSTVVVSADSRQMYKELSIGTAKPDEKQLNQVPHYFIGNKSIQDLFGAGHFAEEARALLQKLFTHHSVIILVGGSGLYIDALLNGVDSFDEVPIHVREELNEQYKKNGLDWLRQQLLLLDPKFAATADLSNPQRMIRALEVIKHTGKPFSDFRKGSQQENEFRAIPLLISTERAKLYQQINTRVDQMMAQGLLEEVTQLQPYRSLNALKTVGYKELFEYLDGSCNLNEAVEKIKQHTRNYAKRQLTWFRNRGNYVVFEPDQLPEIIQHVELTIQLAESKQ